MNKLMKKMKWNGMKRNENENEMKMNGGTERKNE